MSFADLKKQSKSAPDPKTGQGSRKNEQCR